MRKLILAFMAVVSLGAFAADTTVSGFLVDTDCSSRVAQKGSGAAHSKGCLQACSPDGFGVLTDNKQFVRFDPDGNQKVAKFVDSLTKNTNIKVTVTGTVDGDKMTVSKIELQ